MHHAPSSAHSSCIQNFVLSVSHQRSLIRFASSSTMATMESRASLTNIKSGYDRHAVTVVVCARRGKVETRASRSRARCGAIDMPCSKSHTPVAGGFSGHQKRTAILQPLSSCALTCINSQLKHDSTSQSSTTSSMCCHPLQRPNQGPSSNAKTPTNQWRHA